MEKIFELLADPFTMQEVKLKICRHLLSTLYQNSGTLSFYLGIDRKFEGSIWKILEFMNSELCTKETY